MNEVMLPEVGSIQSDLTVYSHKGCLQLAIVPAITTMTFTVGHCEGCL